MLESSYVLLLLLLLFSRLSDLVTCSTSFNVWTEGFICQAWNTVERKQSVIMFIRHLIVQQYSGPISKCLLKFFFSFDYSNIGVL